MDNEEDPFAWAQNIRSFSSQHRKKRESEKEERRDSQQNPKCLFTFVYAARTQVLVVISLGLSSVGQLSI